jgi:MFS family permease
VNATEIRAACALAAIYILRMLGLFMVMPVLAILALDYQGYTPWLVGLAIGGYGLTQALLQIPMGMLSDRIGRKPVIVGGLVCFAIGSIVAGMADSMTWLIIGRIMQGAGAIAGAVMALAADVTRESQRTKVMAIIGISIGFSFYLALILGPVLSSSYGLSGIFYITALLSVAGIGLVLFIVPNATNIAPSADTLPRLSHIKVLFTHPQLPLLNISVCLLHMFITILFVQLPRLLSDSGIALSAQWTWYLPVLLCSIVGLLMLMRLAKTQPKGVMLISIIAMTLCFAGLAYHAHSTLNLSYLYAFAIVFFIGFNYLEANIPALVSSIAPAGNKGSAMGIYASFQFFGAFLGGIVSGLMISSFSETALYTLCILIGVVWLIIISMLSHHERLKRVTLSLNQSNYSVAEIATRLQAITGIKDITVVEDEQAVYLKVDPATFDLTLAQQAVH